ncbi:MAG: helix-turn-helix transcriptional regulator [Lachnospiraceae bacterium]|nr:helix-turn-helix transcriptional regulator [Lachnospiraceae bacterium]
MGSEVTFGRFIAIRRRHLQLTQAELADKMGVSKSAIAKWETGGGLPDRNNLRKLSEAMNVSVDDLHQVIEHEDTNKRNLQVNITPEVIAMLESYGYKVISPDNQKEE